MAEIFAPDQQLVFSIGEGEQPQVRLRNQNQDFRFKNKDAVIELARCMESESHNKVQEKWQTFFYWQAPSVNDSLQANSIVVDSRDDLGWRGSGLYERCSLREVGVKLKDWATGSTSALDQAENYGMVEGSNEKPDNVKAIEDMFS